MNIKCLVIEYFQHKDLENKIINLKNQEIAEQIESILGIRKTFCNCNVEK